MDALETCPHCSDAFVERAICNDNGAAICWECQQRDVSLPEVCLGMRDSKEPPAASFTVCAFAIAA